MNYDNQNYTLLSFLQSTKVKKNGIKPYGKQNYLCQSCSRQFIGDHYTVVKKLDVKTSDTKRIAFEMYLEGLGFRAIGRILGISYVTVYQWIKKWGCNLEFPKRNEKIEVIELDEMHTYVGPKNYR